MVRNSAGIAVKSISAQAQLTRLTLAHILWEKQFYVDAVSVEEKMAELITKILNGPTGASFVSNLAIKARTDFKLRHVPLLLARELARNSALHSEVLNAIIQRPDEMSEFLSLYWQDGKVPLSNQVKKGLAGAFLKFNEYALAKWDKNSAAVSLRDVMFMTHPKPADEAQEALFKRVANKELNTPDTWETELSAGADKRETFVRLMCEDKLGALAFLRNLRNMSEAGVASSTIRGYAKTLNVDKVLPFRFIAAARIMPMYEDMLEEMMFRSLAKHEKLPGKTVLLVDVSGSMFGAKVSAKSDLDRFDAAAALAILCREICEEVEIYSFSDACIRVAPRRGFALIDELRGSQQHSGTDTSMAVRSINANSKFDRVILFTDEQTTGSGSMAVNCHKAYVLNVASYSNGINHGDWTTITGFSEAVIDYIQAFEKSE
jgi:hypothetical protein